MILTIVDAVCRIRDAVLRVTRGAECPVCFDRTHYQTAHHYVNHSTRGLLPVTDFLHVYADSAGEYRWSYLAGNGPKLSDSGQGYTDRRDAVHGFAILNRIHPGRVPLYAIDECNRHEGHTCWVVEIPRITFQLGQPAPREPAGPHPRRGMATPDPRPRRPGRRGRAIDARGYRVTVERLEGPA